MSLYRRPASPFWQYQFSLHGRRFRGSTGETVKGRARQIEAELRAAAADKRGFADDWRLRDALGSYWRERGRHNASQDTIFAQLERLSDFLGPDTPLADLRSHHIMDYRAKQRGRGMKPQSVNRHIATLQAALNHAHKVHGKPATSIAWSALKSAEAPHRLRFLGREEYERLIAVAHPALRGIIAFAVSTGLRRGNILALDWAQVNLDAGYIEVVVKGGKRGQVKITPAIRAILGSAGIRRGKVFDVTGFRKRWSRAVADAGLGDFRFHDLRHTFASWARMAGADIADICDALLHSNIAVTMRYAHILPEQHVTAFDRVSSELLSHMSAQSELSA